MEKQLWDYKTIGRNIYPSWLGISQENNYKFISYLIIAGFPICRKYSANLKFSNLQFFEIFLECSRFHTPRNSSKTKFTPSFSLFLRVTKTSLTVYFADIASFSLCTLQSVGWIFQISVLINVLDIFLLMVKACDLYLKITEANICLPRKGNSTVGLHYIIIHIFSNRAGKSKVANFNL